MKSFEEALRERWGEPVVEKVVEIPLVPPSVPPSDSAIPRHGENAGKTQGEYGENAGEAPVAPASEASRAGADLARKRWAQTPPGERGATVGHKGGRRRRIDYEKVRAMAKAGKRRREIAAALQISAASVANILRKT